MAKMVKIPVEGGPPLSAIEVTYETVREEWNEYALADGGRVRLKTIVQRIYRVVDESGEPQFDPATGDPQLVVRHGTIVSPSE
jgi:hypothetical protein